MGPGRPKAATRVANRSVEQPARQRCRLQGTDRPGPGRLPKNGDVVRIASEGRDVVAHPGEGGHVVQDAVVARRGVLGLGGQGRVRQKAEGTEPVVGGHHQHAFLGHRGPVEDLGTAHTRVVAAAVEPDHDRPPLPG